jgi:hypothetical protein
MEPFLNIVVALWIIFILVGGGKLILKKWLAMKTLLFLLLTRKYAYALLWTNPLGKPSK